MKIRNLTLLVAMLWAVGLVAQDSIIELYRSDVKTEKRAIVAAVMEFTPAEEEAFWLVYRDFEYDLTAVNDRVIALVKNYVASYETLNDETAQSMLKEIFDIKEKRLKLEKSYAKKFNKVISPVKVMRFYQIHNQITMLLDLKVSANIPYVEKFNDVIN